MSEKSPEEYADQLMAEDVFDASAAVNGATLPTDQVRIYTNGALAHEMNELMRQADDARFEAANLEGAAQSIAGDPEADKLRKQADEIDARVQEILKELLASVLTFHMRGISHKQWELIDKKWRKKLKAPARKNYDDGPDGEEEYELETFERNLERNKGVTIECVAASIVKVTNAKGQEDRKAWTYDRTETLYDNLLESEWEKLKRTQQNLTHAHTLFNNVVTQDADFLSKP